MTEYVVIDVGGLGYKVFMSEEGIEKLGNIGDIVKVQLDGTPDWWNSNYDDLILE